METLNPLRRVLPILPYSGLTVILDSPGRLDERKLLSGISGQFFENCLHPISREAIDIQIQSYSDNLEWLFMNFMFREKGARIFLKGGFVPAKIPERAINVNPNPVDTEKN